MPALTEARALSITLTRASSTGKSFRKLQTPSLLISPPLSPNSPPSPRLLPPNLLSTWAPAYTPSPTNPALPQPHHHARRRCTEMVVEVKGEQGDGGGEVEETRRDKSKRRKKEEAKLLHNNMGDLTLLHCSNSC